MKCATWRYAKFQLAQKPWGIKPSFAKRNHLKIERKRWTLAILISNSYFAKLFAESSNIVGIVLPDTKQQKRAQFSLRCMRNFAKAIRPYAWKSTIHFVRECYNISNQIVFDSWKQVERKCNTPFLDNGVGGMEHATAATATPKKHKLKFAEMDYTRWKIHCCSDFTILLSGTKRKTQKSRKVITHTAIAMRFFSFVAFEWCARVLFWNWQQQKKRWIKPCHWQQNTSTH